MPLDEWTKHGKRLIFDRRFGLGDNGGRVYLMQCTNPCLTKNKPHGAFQTTQKKVLVITAAYG